MNDPERNLDDLPQLKVLNSEFNQDLADQQIAVELEPAITPDQQSEKLSLPQRTRKIVAGGFAAGALAGAIAESGVTALADGSTRPHNVEMKLPTSEAQVIKGLESGKYPHLVWDGAILLPAGTPINSRPGGGKISEVTKVNPGSVALLQHPRLLQDGKTTWAGVSVASKSKKPNQATSPSQIFWVNLNTAEHKSGFQSLAYKDSEAVSMNIPVIVNSRHNLKVAQGKNIPPSQLSTIVELKRNSSLPKVLKRLKLVKSKEMPRIIPAAPSPIEVGPTPPPPTAAIVPRPDGPIDIPNQPPPEGDPNAPNVGPIESLPGNHDVLSAQQVETYRSSQLQFLRNRNNWINGTLVSYQGKYYVITCAHGITVDLRAQNPGANYNPDGFFSGQFSTPTNVINQIGETKYTVGTYNGAQAEVTSLVVEDGADIMIAGIDQAAARQLGKTPLPLDSINVGDDGVRPGAQVAADGNSQPSGFARIGGFEKFAGEVNLLEWNNEARTMFAVAANNQDNATAPNGFGTSGRGVAARRADGSVTYLFGNSVRFFGPDRQGNLENGDYAPSVPWTVSQLNKTYPQVTYNWATGFELYSSAPKSVYVSMIAKAS